MQLQPASCRLDLTSTRGTRAMQYYCEQCSFDIPRDARIASLMRMLSEVVAGQPYCSLLEALVARKVDTRATRHCGLHRPINTGLNLSSNLLYEEFADL